MLSPDFGIRRYFQVQLKNFRAIGIDITSTEHTLTRPWILLTTGLGTWFMMFSFALHSWTHTKDLNSMAAALSPLLQCILAMWKMGIFVYQRKDMANLVRRIHQLTKKVVRTTTEFNILKEENAKDIFLSRFYHVAVRTTSSTALIAPFFICAITLYRTGEFSLDTPLKGSYILDTTKPLNYIIVYLFTICLVEFVVNGSVGVDSLYSWYVHNLVAHFRILRLQFSELPEDVSKEHLIHAIKSHQRNLLLAEDLERILRPIIFAEFALNSTQLCFIAYQMLMGITPVGFFFLVTFLSAVAVQIMIYCYGGQRLEDESKAIALVLTDNTNWKSWPVELQKLLQLLILRSQKTCKLTGIFFVVNYPLFLWVVRTAASYITLLSSLN